MHHTTRIPLIHRMMAVMLADHRWSTRRPFEGATRCDKSYVQFLLLSTSVFFSECFLRRKFHCRLIRLADFPVFALCGVGFLEALRWRIGSIGSQWLPAPPFPLPLPPFAMTCSLNWSMDSPADFGLCQPSVNVSPEKNKQNHAKSILNSIPNQSLISILHIICYWQNSAGCINFIIFRPMLPPTICLHLKEAQLLPFASSWEASMKSGRFVPSSFSPCALTQLPKNMPVAQQAQLVWLHVWRFLTLDGSNYAQSKLYVVS